MAFATSSGVGATASEAPRESLADKFGSEINALSELAASVGRACDRLYGPVPSDPKGAAGVPTPPPSLLDQLSALQNVRIRMHEAVSRLNSQL